MIRKPPDAEQLERRAIADNDRRVAGTYSAFAESDANTARGRFTAEAKAHVISQDPISYPALPA